MLTQKQMDNLKALREKADLKDKEGRYNLVARVRATRKGATTGYTTEGCKSESKGSNGRAYYVIRRGATQGKHGPLHLYCDCPAQRFSAKYGNPCKHTAKLLAEANALMVAGQVESPKRDIIIYDPMSIIEAQIALDPSTQPLAVTKATTTTKTPAKA